MTVPEIRIYNTMEEDKGQRSFEPVNRRTIRPLLERILMPLCFVIILLAFWQYALPHGILPGIPVKYLGSPSGVVKATVTMLKHGYLGTPLWEETLVSVIRVLVGFVIGAGVAIPLGLWAGISRRLGYIVNPIVGFLRPIPALAFIPVVTIWFGIGEPPKIIVIAVSTFLFTISAAVSGVRSVPSDYLKSAKNLNLSRSTTLFRVIIPPALPQLITGLRTGMSVSWGVLVAAELIGANRGLGFLIENASNLFLINDVYLGVLIIGLIGIIIEVSFRTIEARVLHWQGK